jgi:hypothetical protein
MSAATVPVGAASVGSPSEGQAAAFQPPSQDENMNATIPEDLMATTTRVSSILLLLWLDPRVAWRRSSLGFQGRLISLFFNAIYRGSLAALLATPVLVSPHALFPFLYSAVFSASYHPVGSGLTLPV